MSFSPTPSSLEPERWSDRTGSACPDAEATFGATFRRVRRATDPSDEDLARATVRARASESVLTRLRFGTAVAVAVVLILATGGVVGAARGHFRLVRAVSPTSTVVAPVETVVRRAPRPREAAIPPAPTREAAPAAPATPVVPVARPEAPPSAPVPPRRPPLDEAATLAEAFRTLRTGEDAASALRALERYERRFPDGLLRSEARIARAEALLALGRRGDALALLRGLADADGALTRGVRIARGELLAETGNCAGAMRDFDWILDGATTDDVLGRALYGRAACALQADDRLTARRDLERYLALFPGGDRVAAARRALATWR